MVTLWHSAFIFVIICIVQGQQFNCTHDIELHGTSCLTRYRDNHCGENWLIGYCCITCGDKSCLNQCYNGSITNYHDKFGTDYNPYDCQSDIPPNSDTCPESYSYQNCEESWMTGYCCNSCPNACNCGTLPQSYYDQGSGSSSSGNNNNGNDGGCTSYDTLSIEEIRKHENNFITLHWILSILILIIPILVVIYFYKHQDEFKDIINITKQQISSGTQEQIYCKLHISHWYQIITCLCILLWYIRIIMEPIQIKHWQNDYWSAKENAVSYDTWKMFIYTFSKFLMYLLFISRIYFSFDGSVYAYSKKFIVGLLIVLILDFVLKIIAYSIAISSLSTDIVCRDYTKISALIPVYVFILLEEIIFTAILVFSFIKPLIKLTSTIYSSKILGIICKYAVLGSISIISSAILSILNTVFIGTDDLMIIWCTNLFISIDCVINSWCNLFLFSFTQSWYELCCNCCDKQIKKIYHEKLSKSGVDTEHDVHADKSVATKRDNMDKTMTLNNPSKTPSKSGDHLMDDIQRPSAMTVSTAVSDDGELPKHRTLNTVASITAFESNNSNDIV